MRELNRRISLKQYSVEITDERIFSLEPIPISEPSEGEVLVRTLYLSVDPYMRNLMTGATRSCGVKLKKSMADNASA